MVLYNQAVKFFSELNKLFFGYFDSIIFFLIIKINYFRGDLRDISAKTATLQPRAAAALPSQFEHLLLNDSFCVGFSFIPDEAEPEPYTRIIHSRGRMYIITSSPESRLKANITHQCFRFQN